MQHPSSSNNLLEILDKILDKGLVVAGDIKVSLADVELLTIKIRLIVASVDKARAIGLDWWERDPYLSSKAISTDVENVKLNERLTRLERLLPENSISGQTNEEGTLL